MTTKHEDFAEHVAKLEKSGVSILSDMTRLKAEFAHMGLLVTSEAGELGDAIKAHVIYGRPLDVENVLEECGDILFAVQSILSKIGKTLDDAINDNIDKLSVRYSSGSYSDAQANARADKQDAPATPLTQQFIDGSTQTVAAPGVDNKTFAAFLEGEYEIALGELDGARAARDAAEANVRAKLDTVLDIRQHHFGAMLANLTAGD